MTKQLKVVSFEVKFTGDFTKLRMVIIRYVFYVELVFCYFDNPSSKYQQKMNNSTNKKKTTHLLLCH